MNKIARVSTVCITILNVMIIAVPLALIASWIWIDSECMRMLISQKIFFGPVSTPEGLRSLNSVAWTPLTKWLGLASDIWLWAPFSSGLIILRAILQRYRAGDIFSRVNARAYRWLGLICFYDALLAKTIGPTLKVLAVTWSNPVGHRYLTLSVGTQSFAAAFYGVLIMVVAWVMEEASKMSEEQRLTI